MSFGSFVDKYGWANPVTAVPWLVGQGVKSAVTGEEFDPLGKIKSGVSDAAGAVKDFVTPPAFSYQPTIYDPGRETFQLPNVDQRTAQLGEFMRRSGESAQGQAARQQYQQAISSEQARQQQALGALQPATNLLAQAAQGQGPSVAELQQQRATEQAIRQQQGEALNARGVNPALAQAMAAKNIGGIQQQAASDAAQLRAQEQQQAQRAYYDALAGQAGLGLQGAGLTLGAQGQVRGEDLAAAQLRQQGQQFGLTNLLGLDRTQADLATQYAQLLAQQQANANALGFQAAQTNYQGQMLPYQAAWGAAGQLGGALGAKFLGAP